MCGENALFPLLLWGWLSSTWVSLSLSGTAAFGRQTGCFASGENKQKCQGKGRQSAKLTRTQQLGSGFSPGIFACFHCARKLAIFRPQHNTRNLSENACQVTSRGVGPGRSPPWCRVRGRIGLEKPRQISVLRKQLHPLERKCAF